MSVWSWDLPFEELALPPHGYHMAAIWLPQRSYSDYCSVTVSLNHCGYVGIYSAQATSQVYKAGGFHLYPPALVSQLVLWLHLPHWLPTFLIVFYLLLTVSDILLTIILLLLTVTLLLPHYCCVASACAVGWCSLLCCSCLLLWCPCSLSLSLTHCLYSLAHCFW